MNSWRFDWRWIVLIVFVALLANANRIPWPLLAGTFLVSGGYMIYYAWQSVGGMGFGRSTTQVKYWRGQRYEVRSPRRGPSLPSTEQLGPLIIYLGLGLILLLSGASIILNRI
jgi:hypothetical protein